MQKEKILLLFLGLFLFSCTKKSVTPLDAEITVHDFINCFLNVNCQKAEEFISFPFWEDRLVYDNGKYWSSFCSELSVKFRTIRRETNLSVKEILPLYKLYTLEQWETFDQEFREDKFYDYIIDHNIIADNIYFAVFFYPPKVIDVLIKLNNNIEIPERQKNLIVILHKLQNNLQILGVDEATLKIQYVTE